MFEGWAEISEISAQPFLFCYFFENLLWFILSMTTL